MKCFWWQGGIHIEPESAEEGKAMRLLYDAAKRTSIAADGGDGPKTSRAQTLNGSPASADQQFSKDIIADL